MTYNGALMRPVQPAFPEQLVAVPPSRTPVFVCLDLCFEKRCPRGASGRIGGALDATLSPEVTGVGGGF